MSLHSGFSKGSIHTYRTPMTVFMVVKDVKVSNANIKAFSHPNHVSALVDRSGSDKRSHCIYLKYNVDVLHTLLKMALKM